MNPRADFLLRSPLGEPIAVVELKNAQTLSPESATALRRNMRTHGLLFAARYFLVLSQTEGFLWDERQYPHLDAPPGRVFSMAGVIDRYLRPDKDYGWLREGELGLVVSQWLSDLADGAERVPDSEAERNLEEAGFLRAVRGADVLSAATA